MTLIVSMCLVACAVCWGDPDSSMVKGAEAGVLVLAGVIVGVLSWVGGTAVFFVRRAKRNAALESKDG